MNSTDKIASEICQASVEDAAAENRLIFRPPWYLRSGHIQTILTAVVRPKKLVPPAQRGIVDLGIRGSTFVYRNFPSSYRDPKSGPNEAFVLLHGLGSCHSGSYMTGICSQLILQGYQVVRIDTPGAGPSHELTDLPPHAGNSENVLKVLRWVSKNWGIKHFRLIGFSLGGNISLHLAAFFADELNQHRRDKDFSIESIHALAPPIDLAFCCRNMESGLNRIYASYFLRGLRRSAVKRAQRWESWRQVQAGFRAKTIRAFDEQVTAPMAGFSGADEYYAFSSVHQRLHNIEIPATIIADAHDPIVPYRMFDNLNLTTLPKIKLLNTHSGGHLGYYHRSQLHRLDRWADQAFTSLFVRDYLESPSSANDWDRGESSSY